MAIDLFPDLETQIRIAEAIENLNITSSVDLTPIEEEISDIKADYVTKISLDLQLLEKLNIRPNGTDLLVIDGKINSVYIDSLYVTDIEVVDTVAEMLTLSNMKRGDIAIVTETETTYILKQEPSNVLGNWVQFLSKPEVISVNGKTGIVHIGISDIDNLQSILNSKLDVTTYENDKQTIEQVITNLESNKLDKNANITAGTSPKITYDAKGLVTGGSALVASDIPNLDAGKITTGIFDAARIPNLAPTKITQNASNRFVTDTEKSTWNSKVDEAQLDLKADITYVDDTIGDIETILNSILGV